MTDVGEIADIFELLGDWEQRYEYLIEVGEQLDPMPEEEKTEDNRVKPCMSRVYVRAFEKKSAPGLLYYHGDCDTAIIKGVVALLVQLFSGKTAEEIEQTDVDELFERIRLAENLSPNRHVGVYAIVEVMKQQAAEFSHRASDAA